jgi:hypothetical protein
MLYAFRRVHMHISDDHSQAPEFCSQLARRAVYDEFDVAFARWVRDDSLAVALCRDYEREPVCRRTRYRPQS